MHYTSEELENQVLLLKDWCRYKMKEHWKELIALKQVQKSQENALKELRLESEKLYRQAIQVHVQDQYLAKYNNPHLIPQ